MNDYERGKLQGFTLGLAWFTAEEQADIALHLPPAAAYDSIREKLYQLETYPSENLMRQRGWLQS